MCLAAGLVFALTFTVAISKLFVLCDADDFLRARRESASSFATTPAPTTLHNSPRIIAILRQESCGTKMLVSPDQLIQNDHGGSPPPHAFFSSAELRYIKAKWENQGASLLATLSGIFTLVFLAGAGVVYWFGNDLGLSDQNSTVGASVAGGTHVTAIGTVGAVAANPRTGKTLKALNGAFAGRGVVFSWRRNTLYAHDPDTTILAHHPGSTLPRVQTVGTMGTMGTIIAIFHDK